MGFFFGRISSWVKARPIRKLRDSGVITIGGNTKFRDLIISVPSGTAMASRIRIGKDCIIQGEIILNTLEAEVIIGDRVYIGPGTRIICNENVTIGNDTLISWNCTIIDNNAHSLASADRQSDVTDWSKGMKDWSKVEVKPVKIEDKSWIGFNSIVLKGVTLGEGSVVAAASVVTKSTDAYTIVGGNPAAFIKSTN